MCYIMSLLELLCSQLENLKSQKIEKRNSTSQNEDQPKIITSKEKLVTYIKFHQKTIEITRKVEKLFSITIFIEGLFSTLILCTTAFILTIISPTTQTVFYIQNVFMLITWSLQILLPCYYSHRVQIMSDNLSASLFHSDWFNEDAEYRKIVEFFILNAKRPLKISALGIFKVDLETFVRIINSTYSLYAVIKSKN